MSADLLAAFGKNDSDSERYSSSSSNQVTPRPDPWRSIPPKSRSVERDLPLWEQDEEGRDVLFDATADELGDEDDFGDFENAEDLEFLRRSAAQHQSTSFDLLNLDEQTTGDRSISHLPKSTVAPAQAAGDPFDIFKDASPQQQSISETPPVANDADDDWGDFENVDQAHELKSKPRATPSRPAAISQVHSDPSVEEEWDLFEDGPSPEQDQKSEAIRSESKGWTETTASTTTTNSQIPGINRERPTNIPPPYSLLQLLSLAVQNMSSQSKREASDFNLNAVASGIVSVYRTSCRIIAGRTYRWKRDTILAQSMRISEVNQKNTGMKLTSLDRSETIKEDQEAIEAVTAWTKYNHILNPILVKAKVQKPAMSLKADMKVRAMNGPGILNERESCAICGLKRNERVIGIDVQADDVFEEFWVQHWGHTDCNTFWFKFKGLLGQR